MPFTIRNATADDAEALAACVIEPIEATFRGRVPDQCLESLTYEESETNWRRFFAEQDEDGRFLLVAESESRQVVGCALGGPQPEDDRFDGELYLLGVLPAFQGRGIGQQLVSAVATRLRDLGLHACGVRVLRANPNTAFYEHIGAQLIGEEPYDWNGVVLPEDVYVWMDLSVQT